jgi:hypothetical protein
MVLSSIVVQNLNDAAAGSLRDAIAQANLDPALDAISFAPGLSGTIALASPLPDLSTTMVIAGPGQDNLTIQVYGSITIPEGAAASISGLTFKGGIEIANHGTLALTDVTIRGMDSFVSLVSGGGLRNTGTLALVGSTICYTSSMSNIREGAGAISNTGTMSIREARIFGNVGYSSGGGVRNLGDLSIEDATISGNRAGVVGGGRGSGIDNQGRLLVVNTTLSDNSAGGAFGPGPGGGIFNEGEAVLRNVIMRGNDGGYEGGGIANFGMLTITNSTVADNVATSRVQGLGGGVYNEGTLIMIATSVAGNQASGNLGVPVGGGIVNAGSFTLQGSLVSGNVATRGSEGVAGGIYNSGSMEILNTTITGNSSPSALNGILSVGDLSLVFVTMSANGSTGVGLAVTPNPGRRVTAINSILDNQGGPSVYASEAGAFVSLGHNLFSDQPYFAVDSTDLINTNPMLGPLADNGGPTQTMALLPGSPAICVGIALPGVTTDQRGVPRLSYRQPDIGAYEIQLPPVVLGVRRFGVHREPTSLAVVFSQPMDAVRAGDLNAYRLTTAGNRVVPIASVSYDPVSFTTTLRLSRLLPLRGAFRLTVRGTPPNGLTDAQGLFLDGAGNRQAGE